MLTDESHHSLGTDPLGASAIAEAQRVIKTSEAVAVEAGTTHSDPSFPTAAERRSRLGSGQGARMVQSFFLQQQRPLFLGSLYALGHGTVVAALGVLAILASEFLPSRIDPIMERVVGGTLIFLATYLFYSLYRFFRGGDFRIRSRWMLIFAGVRNGFNWLWARIRGERQYRHVEAQQYGVRTAYGIGLIHGIGAETGTQVLVIATAVGAGSKAMSVATLVAFVVGLLIANSIVTIATTAGFVSARRRKAVYAGVGLLAAVFSLAIGLFFLAGAGVNLPDLGGYFRWIGGPNQ